MNDIQLSKFLGWFSIGLGTLEVFASRHITTMLGVASPRLIQAFGVREIASGLSVLNKPDTALPVWGRVAGDVMDLAVIAAALSLRNRQRGKAAAVMLLVLGVTAVDIAVASALSQRDHKALRTGRRTRVQRILNEPNN